MKKEYSEYDEYGLISQIGIINKDGVNVIPKFAKPNKIKEKLDFYRTFFNKIEDLSDAEYEALKLNFIFFFNVLPKIDFNYKIPQYLYRISKNNDVFKALEKPLSCLRIWITYWHLL